MTQSSSTAAANNVVVVNMSTMALESKLKTLRSKSNTASTTLTQKLASSQSGQDLLHIGTSLQSLPPDLALLQTSLHPLLGGAESLQTDLTQQLQHLDEHGSEIQTQLKRIQASTECAQLYTDLQWAEECVNNNDMNGTTETKEEEQDAYFDEADEVLLLERAAWTSARLVQELEQSTKLVGTVTTTPKNSNIQEDTEQAQFVLKLAPRIRSLERNVVSRLEQEFEDALDKIKREEACTQQDLLIVGHCIRGLALLGRGSQVESVFARVAIMPLIGSKVSMGHLDKGGARGDCAGLRGLLHEVLDSIGLYREVLQLSESYELSEVDLVTAGVWVPIATALMADPAIQMAIFSPGIASVLQANYSTLDSFLSELAQRLLGEDDKAEIKESLASDPFSLESLYFQPKITAPQVSKAQERIYRHSMTGDFAKKWNLPIYYQLRFGEACGRLNRAIDAVQQEGWESSSSVFTGTEEQSQVLKDTIGLELDLFLELYCILTNLWAPDVVLRPLSHRFLRGAVQLMGRTVAFVKDGLEGKLEFGSSSSEEEGATTSYKWGDNLRHVAAVAWDLTVLATCLTHDYIDTIVEAVGNNAEEEDVRLIATDVLKETADQIGPLVQTCWNDVIVSLLVQQCSGPLQAVKGVGATYRMTNRPPPTRASPFCAMILRPLAEFHVEFQNRTPPQVGETWKLNVVQTIASKYSMAVEELLVTIKKTEVALKNRSSRLQRTSQGLSDGEKVKLQLYLDYQEFVSNVVALGIESDQVEGIQKLKSLTMEGHVLLKKASSVS